MNQIVTTSAPQQLFDVATKAVFVLQYSTPRAVHYIQTQLPDVSEAAAKIAISVTAKPLAKH